MHSVTETSPVPTSLRFCECGPSPQQTATDPYILQYNDLLLSVLSERGYTGCIIWNQDTQDGNEVPADVSKGVYDQVNGGDLVLGHSVYDSTANDVVPYGISLLKNKGLELVSVDTCLGSQGSWPYEYIGEPQSGNWQC